ncbi:MAG: hypothetical protein WAL29_17210, partial [Bacteroidales bacterium]
MGAGGIFTLSKGTKVVLAITFTVSVLAILFAFFYYRDLNNLEDPRTQNARELLAIVDNGSSRPGDFSSFSLLDSANAVFRTYPDYKASFETGVIYNNKCSALLMAAIYDSTISTDEKSKLLDLSMRYCDSSIRVYKNWISVWEKLSGEDIAEKIRPLINENDNHFEGLNFRRIFEKRVKDLIVAQVETPRRLSVSLSNKGTIYRHKLLVDSAFLYYQQALAIWKDNRTAKSNLNVLM